MSRIIRDVTAVVADKAVHEVHMLSTLEELRTTVQGFSRIRNFPRVIGAIDCKITYHCPDTIVKCQNYGFSVVEVIVKLHQHGYMI